jgi:hypothetical protein
MDKTIQDYNNPDPKHPRQAIGQRDAGSPLT